jgi:hypothetical protein
MHSRVLAPPPTFPPPFPLSLPPCARSAARFLCAPIALSNGNFNPKTTSEPFALAAAEGVNAMECVIANVKRNPLNRFLNTVQNAPKIVSAKKCLVLFMIAIVTLKDKLSSNFYAKGLSDAHISNIFEALLFARISHICNAVHIYKQKHKRMLQNCKGLNTIDILAHNITIKRC